MYIDTHCHISKEDYDDIDNVIQEDIENKISKIIISGCTKDMIEETLEIVNKYDNIYATIGYHPSEVDNFDLKSLENQLQNNKVVGLGEIGLDYYYGTDTKDKQIQLFEKQLQIAENLNIPVVIHSRDAVQDTINILKKYRVKGIIHCFSGSLEVAKEYISMGFLLGIGGVVTFKNSKLPLVIKEVGLDNIVLETDSPYLTPEPFRGMKNSSKYIPYIAEKIANILDLDIKNVAEVTTSNAINLFDLK